MISYGFSIQGKSHIQHGVVCQDYSKHIKLNSKWYLGIVADGVGSAPYSDIGSKLAVESLCEFCQQKIDSSMSKQQLEELLRQGYEYAWRKTVAYVEKENGLIDDYDTTLSAVLYDGRDVIYGHAGDGGIIAKMYDGTIKPITERQKGADGTSVRPLRAGEISWSFGIYEKPAAAVLLATDGMLDGVFQPNLLNLPSDAISMARGDFQRNNAYITAAEFFMNPNGIYMNKKIKNPDQFMKKYMIGILGKEDRDFFLECMKENYAKMLGRNGMTEVLKRLSECQVLPALVKVTDDKSVVCLMNERANVTPQGIEYYYEPDWRWRNECHKALLYNRPMPPKPETENPRRIVEVNQEENTGQVAKTVQPEKIKQNVPAPVLMEERPAGAKYKMIKRYLIIVPTFLLAFVIALAAIGLVAKKFDSNQNTDDTSSNQVAENQDEIEKPVEPSRKPTATPEPTKTPEVLEIGSRMNEKRKKVIQETAKEFLNCLKTIDLSDREYSGYLDSNKGLGEVLKDLKEKFISQEMENEGGTSRDMSPKNGVKNSSPTDSPSTPSPSPSQSMGNNGSENQEKDIESVLEKLSLLNTQEEANIFKSKLEKIYRDEDSKDKEVIIKRLKVLLDM